MRRIVLIVLVLLLAVGVGYVYGTRPHTKLDNGAYQNNGRVKITRPVVRDNSVVLQPHETEIPKSGDPIEHTLNALLATADDGSGTSAIPRGTKLLSVSVKDGLATIDLSDDFNQINHAGDTSESLAYNALRKALAQFPQVERMRVLVEGKTFEGEHSGDWSDIPVRDEKTQTGSNQ